MTSDVKVVRNYGYEVLINTFELFLRDYIINEIFIPYYLDKWREFIPKQVWASLRRKLGDLNIEELSIEELFEELYFINLKDILLFSSNFSNASSLLGKLNKSVFGEKMSILNGYRKKIAHPRRTFNYVDLLDMCDCIYLICQGEDGKSIRQYLDNKEYLNSKSIDIPQDFFEEYDLPNNLPPENYDLDGGFVGREKEIQTILNLINSEQDRVITITGAGGVGKTAIALKVAYTYLVETESPFETILWFSAKERKLTDYGIVSLTPEIESSQQLVEDMLDILNPDKLEELKTKNMATEDYIEYLYDFFSSQKCLIVIDNLETIIEDNELVEIIKNIPRPSQVLITSRKGLGEIERRYPLGDMLESDAIRLFKLIARERNISQVLNLREKIIGKLVKRVRCYPLLIKWSLGQIALGRDIEEAFSDIFSGDSEIAKFSFNDVFKLLKEESKRVLYVMIIAGDRPISKHILRTVANLNEDELDDVLRELTITSFIYQVPVEVENKIVTKYTMLELTRGFIQNKLDEDKKLLENLITRYYDLSDQIRDLEKSKISLSHHLQSIGIKTIDDKIAYNYVKTAKNYEDKDEIEEAEKNYKLAVESAPRLSYVYTEYSKFEFYRDHHHESLKLAEKAIQVNPDSFHAWLNHGIILRKTRDFYNSITSLKKAKELNPTNLLTHLELGKAYSLNKEYEKAENEFKEALKEEKYPNYRHKRLTLYSMSDNYRRWADEFRTRADSKGQLEKLFLAKKAIDESIKISRKDWKIWQLYRKINVEIGIVLCQNNNFTEGIEFLAKSIAPVNIDGKVLFPSGDEAARGYYFLAFYADKAPNFEKNEITSFIKKGLNKCLPSSKWFKKLIELQEKLEIELRKNERLHGVIVYFNESRGFGRIESLNVSYFFLMSSFSEYVDKKKTKIKGRSVSFLFKNNIKKYAEKNPYLAYDIKFEEE
ncbi:MAG: ATP-binding protein [Candidatus Heimdallarchaeaceae archaeon]